MRVIENFDSKNYEMCTGYFYRKAVRAIIIKDGKIALIKSTKFGEYKFPGGGMEDGESDYDTLIRETKEETGLSVIPESIMVYGLAKEKRRSVLNPDDLFEMDSYYYTCNVLDTIEETNLDSYEHHYGYELQFVSIDQAIDANKNAAQTHQKEAPWINRELAVFIDLKKQKLL